MDNENNKPFTLREFFSTHPNPPIGKWFKTAYDGEGLQFNTITKEATRVLEESGFVRFAAEGNTNRNLFQPGAMKILEDFYKDSDSVYNIDLVAALDVAKSEIREIKDKFLACYFDIESKLEEMTSKIAV